MNENERTDSTQAPPWGRRTTPAEVLEFFKKCWPHRTKYPSEINSYSVAATINNVFDAVEKAKLGKPSKVGKYATILAAHIARERPAIARRLAQWPRLPEEFQAFNLEHERMAALLAAMDAASQAAERLRTALESRTPLAPPIKFETARKRYEAKRIADAARQAWALTDPELRCEDVSRGTAPLCEFVSLALKNAGILVGEHGASELLRARERKRPGNEGCG